MQGLFLLQKLRKNCVKIAVFLRGKRLIFFIEFTCKNGCATFLQDYFYKKKGCTFMEYQNEYASKGVAGAGLGLGIAGTALGLMNGGGLGNIFGGYGWNRNMGCAEEHFVNRYEAEQAAKIANLETEVKLRDANFYALSEVGNLRDYMEKRFDRVEHELCDQKVYNATNTAAIGCIQNQIAVLQGLTKTVIPFTSICPEPMARYNNWVAPTANAGTTTP